MEALLMTIEKHFSVKEVAEALGKNTRTILRWIEAGKIRAAALPGLYDKPSYGIPRSELERLGVSIIDNPNERDSEEED